MGIEAGICGSMEGEVGMVKESRLKMWARSVRGRALKVRISILNLMHIAMGTTEVTRKAGDMLKIKGRKADFGGRVWMDGAGEGHPGQYQGGLRAKDCNSYGMDKQLGHKDRKEREFRNVMEEKIIGFGKSFDVGRETALYS